VSQIATNHGYNEGMKKLSRCLWLGLVTVCLLSLAGCGSAKSWDKQLIGSWQGAEPNSGHQLILVYKDGGECEIKTPLLNLKGSWEVLDQEKRHIKYWSGLILGDAAAKANVPVLEVTIKGDKLTLRNVEKGTSEEYSRVPDGTEVPKGTVGTTSGEANPAATSQGASAAPAAPMSEEDRKYIQMYSEVLTHIHAAEKAISRHWVDPIDEVLANATKHFDAAWAVHVKHFGTPPRFQKADEDLRLGLKKWSEGLEALKTRSRKDEIDEAIKLIAASQAEYEKQTGILLGKN